LCGSKAVEGDRRVLSQGRKDTYASVELREVSLGAVYIDWLVDVHSDDRRSNALGLGTNINFVSLGSSDKES
jgi:hypothetical protein